MDEPSFDEIVDAVIADEAFRATLGDGEKAAVVAEAAVRAALVYCGLFAMIEDVRHEVAGHG